MDDRRLPRGPGKTAPRLINDLQDYDPRYLAQNVRNLLVDPAPIYKGTPILRKGVRDCRHLLMKKDEQTTAIISNDERPCVDQEYVVAAYCTLCRCHFKISMDYWRKHDSQVPCNLADEANPMHHLRLVGSIYAKEYNEKYGWNKYDPLTEAHEFVCSSPTCPLKVEIKLSPPRLSSKRLAAILDPGKVDARGRREIHNDPVRLEGKKPVTPLQALSFLRTYLFDAKSAANTTEQRKIAKRNKSYMLAFANECDPIFEYLDFTPFEAESSDVDEGINQFWRLPVITDANRNFFEDVLVEIDLHIMTERSKPEQQIALTRPIHKPVPALKDIERSLGYFDYPTRSRTIDLSTEEHPHYPSLGVVDNFTDDLLIWAYDRQCECDPSNKPYYLDCLQGIATGRESPDLQMKVVMATSNGEHGLKAIEEAYKYFSLSPDTMEADDHIMGLYKSRIVSAPRQKDEARECLLVLVKARNSEAMEALANDRSMTFEEALEFLSVSADTASDSIEAAAIAMSIDADKAKVARALRVIANQRPKDFTLQRAAAQMEGGGADTTLDISEAYNRLQINAGARNIPDETILAYYNALSNGAPSGSKDSYTEALRVIALDRQSHFLLRKLDDPNADVQAESSTADEPVGLDNIGNTCYLNSLLQYLYTVKPLRDMVIDFQNHRMTLNEEDIKKKKVGGRSVDKAEIIKAVKMADELHDLFKSLKTASTRSVKPTRDLAELLIFSTAAYEGFRKASISSPSGPPNIASIMNGPVYGPQWPPPSTVSKASTTPPEEDIEMVDHPGDKNLENGDDSSEATLVDMELPPSYNETQSKKDNQEVSRDDKDGLVTAPEVAKADSEGDAVMLHGANLSNELDKRLSATEKPPPIPPRNKSGLMIQTTETNTDDLWAFGSQQDVTEAIGNVLFRLQCAIKPTSLEENSGEQVDVIRDTFYGSNITYTQKAQSLEKKVEAWPSIIAFPDRKGPRDIYEAIDVVYDQQIVQIDKTTAPQFASIGKLPPILQIHIQRTDYDKDSGRATKNQKPVLFPETIYMDRYVDSDDMNSVLMRRRLETWRWKAQLRSLQARLEALKTTKAEMDVAEALVATKEFVTALQEAEIDGIEVDPALPDALDERIGEVVAEIERISGEIAGLKQSLKDQFTDMREYEYKLQSVFIHRGEAGGGHYWVYIYDFANSIWREYNDEYVTEVKDRRRIFEHQEGAGGTPYYLVYVRSADEKDLVEAVCRDPQEVQITDVTGTWAGQMEDEGIAMVDEEDDEVRHVEHAKPRPLRPKPAVQDKIGDWDAEWNNSDRAAVDANGRPWP